MFFFLISVVYFCITFIGCTSSYREKEVCSRLIQLDTSLIKEYNAFLFSNKYSIGDTNVYFVITRKNIYDKVCLKNYELIKNGNDYCFTLYSVDYPIDANIIINSKINIRGQKYIQEVSIGSYVLVWEDGKIISKVYFSDDLKEKYILKGRRNK